MKNIAYFLTPIVFFTCFTKQSQVKIPREIIVANPPMGWLTWNYFADIINETDLRQMEGAMVATRMVEAGYNHILIDDGWQSGRDNRKNIIAI